MLKIAEKPPKASWVFFAGLKNVLKIAKKNSLNLLGWVFFAELKNVLKIAKKPPKISWVFFDVEKCAKNVKKQTPKYPGSSLQN